MFLFAIFIGIYSYLIFALGILGLLTKINIMWVTILWFFVLLFFEKKFLYTIYQNSQRVRFSIKKIIKSPIAWLIILIVLQALVNLIGALGPELAFDALWYHLTLPKLYLLHQTVYHIPGSLLYYSDMPKLGEMLYTGALSLGNEITAKVIHFSFGILILIVLYKLARKFFTPFVSLLVVLIFYSNLVVDWESITAYIDLIRTFFETLALWGFINWIEQKSWKWLVLSAIMIGLAITSKVLAIGSLMIFVLLIFVSSIKYHVSSIRDIVNTKYFILNTSYFILIALLVPLPWFIFSFIHTGNPVYPFFSHTYEISASSPNPLQFIVDLWNLFTRSADPISPVYIIFIPLLFVTFSKFQKEIKFIVWYSGLSILLWYFTPQTGGGRFIMPYLPAFSLICGAIYSEIFKKTRREWKFISRLLLITIMFVSCISIGYRFIANAKYIPVILGRESKATFLKNHLNFHFGDFADIDGYFANHIKSSDTVLLFGFHNLYYVDFPFIDSSWVKRGDKFDYLVVQNASLPSRFKNWQLVYKNDKTLVQLYKPPKGECLPTCHY